MKQLMNSIFSGRRSATIGLMAAAMLAGCAGQQTSSNQNQLEEQLIAAEAERARMQAQLEAMRSSEQSGQKTAAAPARQAPAPVAPTITAQPVADTRPMPAGPAPVDRANLPPGMASSELPPNPRAGECYARLYFPPQYENRSERVLKSDASEKVDIIPPEYTLADERVLTTAAYEKVVEVLPPVYKTVKEDVIVRPAFEKIETVPAKYNNVTEKILEPLSKAKLS